jgi:seryl-tRNA synthetase
MIEGDLLGDAENQKQFLDELLSARLLLPSSAQGVYGRSAVFESIVSGIERLVTETGKDEGAEVWRFPPGIARSTFEQSGYLESFPHMAGTVFSFEGKDKDQLALLAKVKEHGDWSGFQKMTGVVLTPAACYPVYPSCTGTLPQGGKLFDVQSYCFRNEPSLDPARMQMFRQREYVCVAEPERVVRFKDTWLERGRQVLQAVGLGAAAEPANDPFFGRGGKMLALNQREQRLKFELLFPITSAANPTALVSVNHHLDHFGRLFEIRTQNGEPAHTSCIGFGLERITLALLKTHGLDTDRWPAGVRARLWP